MTGAKRSPLVPDLPTISESGVPGYEMGSWQGILAPRGTPVRIINQLNTEIVAVLRLPEVRKLLATEGSDPIGNTTEEFSRWLPAEVAKWSKVIKTANIRVE